MPQGKLDGLQKNKAKIEKELLKETDKLENERKKYDCEIVDETIFTTLSQVSKGGGRLVEDQTNH